MNRILLGIALACTTPACMHLERAPQRHEVREVAPQRTVPRGIPRRAPSAFERAPVAEASPSDLPLQIAAGAAIALGVILYVE